MVMQNLLDLYNFLPLSQLPLLQVQFHRVDTYPPIQQILTRICCFTDQTVQSQEISQSYLLLNEFISKEEETLGPKRFKKLVQSVFAIIVQYLLNVLREQSQQKSIVYFHLTYYRKNCQKYVDSYSSCCMMAVSMITGYKLQQWTGMDEKVKQLRLGLKQLSRSEQHYMSSNIFNRFCSLIQACTTYHLDMLKKAKDLCSKIINTSSLESISAIKCRKEPSSIVKLQLTLCSYTVMKIYQKMGNYELHMFMMNKFLQYAQKFYSGGETFLQLVKRGELRQKQVKVKLTRLQEKIRRIDLTQQQENNKYLADYKIKTKKKTMSRSSSLYSIQQQQSSNLTRQNSTFTKSFSNFSRAKHIMSLHKQSGQMSVQKSSIEKGQKLSNFRQSQGHKKPSIIISSLVKNKQSATNKLKLTKRAIKVGNNNLSATSENKFQSNLARSCSVSFHDTQQFAFTQPLALQSQFLASEKQSLTINNQPLNPTQKQLQLKKAHQHQLQLQNLLILKDNKKNYYQLKQQTLRYLSKQSNQLKRMIRTKNNQISQIQQYKTQLNSELNLQLLKQNINKSIEQQEMLLKQIKENKWNHLQSFPQVKKINSFFKTFLTTFTYWHSKNVYSLVYGEMLNMTQMKMITTLRQKAQKRNKQVISKVIYRNIKHQIEYIKQQLHDHGFTYIMNIYQTEKGQNGINLQFQLSQQDYKIVKYEPFYYNYSIIQGQLVPFEKQLLQLSLKSIYYVNKFIRKIKRYCLRYQHQLNYKIYEIGFNYEHGTEIITNEDKHSNTNDEKKDQTITNQEDNKNTKEQNDQTINKLSKQSYAFTGLYLITRKEISTSNLQKLHNKYSSQQAIFFNTSQQTSNFLPLESISSQKFLEIQSKFDNNPSQQKQTHNFFQLTIQKISEHQYQNQNYNSPLFIKILLPQKDYHQLKILQSALTHQMDKIFNQYLLQIVKIQKLFRKAIAHKTYQIKRQQRHVQTYHHKGVLYTLLINLQTNKNKFFIQKIPQFQQKKYDTKQVTSNTDHINQKFRFLKFPMLIRHDVSFQSLEFLSRLQLRLQQSNTFEEMYNRIEKFMKIKIIASKVFCKTKDIRLFTDFQTQFRKKLCFATIKEGFLFRGKMRQGRIMYMLTVKQFSRMPRPYSLKIFTLESNSMIQIDGEKIIYNKEKIFLESKLESINQVIQILGRNQFQIHNKGKIEPVIKKNPSRISILSNYSFRSLQPSREHIDQKVSSGAINRRASKNSMFAKFRHKALIKNQDLQAIKKLVEERKLNKSSSSSSHLSSQLSKVEAVMSDSSQDKHTEQKNR